LIESLGNRLSWVGRTEANEGLVPSAIIRSRLRSVLYCYTRNIVLQCHQAGAEIMEVEKLKNLAVFRDATRSDQGRKALLTATKIMADKTILRKVKKQNKSSKIFWFCHRYLAQADQSRGLTIAINKQTLVLGSRCFAFNEVSNLLTKASVSRLALQQHFTFCPVGKHVLAR